MTNTCNANPPFRFVKECFNLYNILLELTYPNWLERHTSDFSYTPSFKRLHIKLHYLAFPPFTCLPEHALKWIILHRSVYCCSEKFCALTRLQCCTTSTCLRVSLLSILDHSNIKRDTKNVSVQCISPIRHMCLECFSDAWHCVL